MMKQSVILHYRKENLRGGSTTEFYLHPFQVVRPLRHRLILEHTCAILEPSTLG